MNLIEIEEIAYIGDENLIFSDDEEEVNAKIIKKNKLKKKRKMQEIKVIINIIRIKSKMI